MLDSIFADTTLSKTPPFKEAIPSEILVKVKLLIPEISLFTSTITALFPDTVPFVIEFIFSISDSSISVFPITDVPALI